MDLIPSLGNTAFDLVAFIVALSIIVAVHEYGHYIVGRWTGIKADVFSVGFGPVIWSRNDKHGTKWQIAALPLGGYVKFRGDADAASGKDGEAMSGLTEEERRATMHGAPVWARAATVAAGPIFNFILAIVVFAGLLFLRGVSSDPITIDTMREMPVENGLQQGDVLLEINGSQVPGPDAFYSFATALPSEGTLSYTVERDGVVTTVPGPHPNPSLALSISPDSAAGDIDMRAGDVITAVDGVPVTTFAQLREIVGASDGNPMLLNVWRSGQELEFTIVPRRRDLPVEGGGFETRWLIGISGGLFFEPEAVAPGFGEAVTYGVTQTIDTVRISLSALYNMTLGRIDTCNLQGPIGIAQVAGDAASNGWMSFIGTIALLSVAIGFLNLMPIPVLDGGHLVFHAWEAITGRPPSDGALKVLMATGLSLMIALMVFALSNDLFCP